MPIVKPHEPAFKVIEDGPVIHPVFSCDGERFEMMLDRDDLLEPFEGESRDHQVTRSLEDITGRRCVVLGYKEIPTI